MKTPDSTPMNHNVLALGQRVMVRLSDDDLPELWREGVIEAIYQINQRVTSYRVRLASGTVVLCKPYRVKTL